MEQHKMTKEKRFMLTTVDNPFDPFEDFAAWYIFDVSKGYNSCGLLAIVAKTSKIYSEDENNSLIEEAIDSIVAGNPLRIYKKIEKEIENDE